MKASIILIIMALTVVFLLVLIKTVEVIKNRIEKKSMKKKHRENSCLEFM